MKKVLRILLILIAVTLVGYTFYFLYQKSVEPEMTYNTAKPEKGSVIKKTVATGSIIPRKEIEIKPQVSGIIDVLYVEAGDEVKKGDLIARIKVIPDMAQLNAAENRLNRAQISLDAAKLNYDRNKELHEKGIIADATYQDFEITYRNAQEELAAAESNLEIIKEGAAKKAGETANTLVRSTANGTVLDVPVEEGNSVIEANTFNDGTTIATVADLGEMIFEGKVDESEVGKIRTGMELILNIGALQDEQFNAELEYISPKGVEENGAIQFEIKADMVLREGLFIRAGYSANADIVLARADSVLTIKESLLQFEEGKPYVEVKVGEDQYERREIKTGLSDGIIVEVQEGLGPDDEIKVWNSPVRS